MKNKKLQTKLHNDRRRMHEQAGITLLMMATLIGAVSFSQESRRVLKAVALKPAFSYITNSGKENETTRMPVQYDDVLKMQTIGGR